jgi:hypothetical protein
MARIAAANIGSAQAVRSTPLFVRRGSGQVSIRILALVRPDPDEPAVVVTERRRPWPITTVSVQQRPGFSGIAGGHDPLRAGWCRHPGTKKPASGRIPERGRNSAKKSIPYLRISGL